MNRDYIPITGVLLVYNEAAVIGETIKHMKDHVREVLVVDTNSTDKTEDIAYENGATVLKIDWEADFALARNRAMRHVNTEWTLFLDADERLSVDLWRIVPDLIGFADPPEPSRACSANVDAFYFWRKSIFDGELRGEEYQPRLMRTQACEWQGKVHEGIKTFGSKKDVPKQFYMIHEHTMKRQNWNNLMYQRLLKGSKERPLENRGCENRNGEWVEFENERNL